MHAHIKSDKDNSIGLEKTEIQCSFLTESSSFFHSLFSISIRIVEKMKFAILLGIAFLCGQSYQAQLKLSVYYESWCPDSRRFIINQLYPTLQQLGGMNNPYFTAEFVPYGKANTTFDGGFEFVCQHGENECRGNAMHSCALAKLGKDQAAAFINCMMTSFQPPLDAQVCAQQLGVDFQVLLDCYTSWEGATLLAANGIKTHGLDPQLYYVPWIMYNDIWTLDDMMNSEQDLPSLLCQKLSDSNSTLPPMCDVK